jgi:hypothetical protein
MYARAGIQGDEFFFVSHSAISDARLVSKIKPATAKNETPKCARAGTTGCYGAKVRIRSRIYLPPLFRASLRLTNGLRSMSPEDMRLTHIFRF